MRYETKHIMAFKYKSQGDIRQKVYEIRLGEDAEVMARKLTKWFNLTGGNRDGSFRVFDSISFDKILTEKEYKANPIKYLNVKGKHDWRAIRAIERDLQSIELNGDRYEKEGWFDENFEGGTK